MRGVRHEAGFSLVELLFVVAIVALLAGVALPAYRDHADRARSTAFLVQLDAWRERAAIESQASGADLCRWDEARFGAMRQTIFGQTSMAGASFGEFRVDLAARPVMDGPPAGSARPFVVDVVATAADGERALNVARLLREELDRVGLRYPSPATDRDLPSMQSFSALLGNCQGVPPAVGFPAVAAWVKPVLPGGGATGPVNPVPNGPTGGPPIGPGGTLPTLAVPGSAPASPASQPASASVPPTIVSPLVNPPGPGPGPAGVQPAEGGVKPAVPKPPAVTAASSPTVGGGDGSTGAGSSTGPAAGNPGAPAGASTGLPPSACTGGRQLSADGRRCECRVGNWNSQHQRCVGNVRH